MSRRQDGLKPGEVARAKRVARMVADAIPTRGIISVRNVIARLKEHKLRPRDLDTPNGADALAAIVATMLPRDLQMTVPPLGKIWELVASRAVQYLGEASYR